MVLSRKFRFGLQISKPPAGMTLAGLARKAEDLGFSSLFLPDHFGDQLAPVPALMAAADATQALRVGALVWDNDYKHPVVLAKEAATIDVLSGGRLEFGIGAGWMNTDYEQAGIQKDRNGVRIGRLSEAIQIYKGLWSAGSFSFSGDHYRITELDGLPKPAQRPWPPILVGAGGPRMLALAAKEADIVGVNPSLPKGYPDAESVGELAPAAIDRKIQILRDSAGDRLAELELNILVFVTDVGPGKSARREAMAQALSVSTDDLDASPYAWVGEAKEVAEQLRVARERWGTSYFVVQGEGLLDAAAAVVSELAGS